MTLTHKILSGLYLGNLGVWEVGACGDIVWGLIGVQFYVVTFDHAVKTLTLKIFFPGNISETVKCKKLIVWWGHY